MKTYQIWANPQGDYEAVKQGWSWPAFFFNWIWALTKKMWLLGIGVGAAFMLLSTIIDGDPDAMENPDAMETLLGFAMIFAAAVFGVKGNTWREKHLWFRGYEALGVVDSPSPEAAVAAWLKHVGSDTVQVVGNSRIRVHKQPSPHGPHDRKRDSTYDPTD